MELLTVRTEEGLYPICTQGATNGFNFNLYTPTPQVNVAGSQSNKPEFANTGGFFAQETVYPEGKSVQTVQEAGKSPVPVAKAEILPSIAQPNESSKRIPSPSTTPKEGKGRLND